MMSDYNKQITRCKWVAGIITVIILGIIVFGSKSAKADGQLHVVPMESAYRYVVIEQIPGGHKAYSYRAKRGRVELLEISVTYNDQLMTLSDYNEFVEVELKDKIRRQMSTTSQILNHTFQKPEAESKAITKESDPSGWTR